MCRISCNNLDGDLSSRCTSRSKTHVTTCIILSIEENCDVKNKNNGEDAEENVYADEAEPTPVPSQSDAITAFETVRTFLYSHESTEKHQKNVVNLENLLFNL
ncbi:hypothetical protein NPIL_634271 [Nephila pilipes]|uniref:Uncharacterized protein n=1 Tax=Nephila pilipes TaxID=299642 RepID=A0A8X6NMW9_NEPPI|nr:hypothetical protein NPIL_634271 [Nephila pilipes]